MTTWPTQDQVDALLSQWKQEIADLQRKIDIVETAMRIFDESGSALSTVDVDFDVALLGHCRTQREALREIAKLRGGIVRAREAAPLILRAGLSKGKLTSVVSTVHNLLNSGEEWEYVEPGTFRLIAPISDTTQPNDDNGDIAEESERDHSPAESAPINGNHVLSTARRLLEVMPSAGL